MMRLILLLASFFFVCGGQETTIKDTSPATTTAESITTTTMKINPVHTCATTQFAKPVIQLDYAWTLLGFFTYLHSLEPIRESMPLQWNLTNLSTPDFEFPGKWSAWISKRPYDPLEIVMCYEVSVQVHNADFITSGQLLIVETDGRDNLLNASLTTQKDYINGREIMRTRLIWYLTDFSDRVQNCVTNPNPSKSDRLDLVFQVQLVPNDPGQTVISEDCSVSNVQGEMKKNEQLRQKENSVKSDEKFY